MAYSWRTFRLSLLCFASGCQGLPKHILNTTTWSSGEAHRHCSLCSSTTTGSPEVGTELVELQVCLQLRGELTPRSGSPSLLPRSGRALSRSQQGTAACCVPAIP